MKKALLAVAALMTFAGAAQAGQTFGLNGGYGSSVTLSGGSEAESGQYGNGASSQYSTSTGYGAAVGATGMAAGYSYNGAAAGSVSGVYGTSTTTSYSSGRTYGNGYGDSSSGAAVNYSSYGYGNLAGSYSY